MKIIFNFLSILLVSLLSGHTEAETIKRAYLDKKNNVHIITARGLHQQLTDQKNATSLKVAPDNETIAWLVANTWTAEGDDKAGSEELVVYRTGKYSSIKCTPFIRDYWFWQDGKQVAIDCGGRRFAGREILYDTKTLKQLESFDQAEVPLKLRPNWSGGDN